MNVNTMTAQQAADWCAVQDGWEYRHVDVGVPAGWWHASQATRAADPFCDACGWSPCDCRYAHPHPLTLDGADAAVPAGWYWLREGGRQSHRKDGLYLRWVACQQGADNWRIVETPDTGDKIGDLFRLAVACRMAGKAD